MGSAAKKLTNNPLSSILTFASGGLMAPTAGFLGKQKQDAYDQKSKLNQLAAQSPPLGAPLPTMNENPSGTQSDRIKRIQAQRYGFSSTLKTASSPMPMAPGFGGSGKTLLGS